MKRPKMMMLVLSAVISAVAFVSPDGLAAEKSAPTAKSAGPAGTVPAAEALKRIKAHQSTINGRLGDMTGKYDKNVNRTLRDMFMKSGVHESAMGYASSWAGNGVYLPWVNDVRPFYEAHLDALSASARPLLKGESRIMRKSDLAYLDQGMSVWKEREKKLAALMHDYIYHMSKRAYFLGEAMKYSGDSRYHSTKSPEFRKQYEPSVNAANEMAEKAGQIEQDWLKQLKEAGKARVFSSVNAQNRIGVAEAQDECRDVAVFTPRNVPMPVLCESEE